jgi:phage shock protein A
MSFLFGLLSRSRARGLGDGFQTLEAAYRKQLAALASAQRGVAEVLAAEKRLEFEALQLAASRERFRIAADDAARRGDEDTARAARENESFVAFQRERVLENAVEVRRSRVALESMAEGVRLRVELFRTEKLAVGARFVAARAASRSGSSLAVLGDEMREIALLAEHARATSQQALAGLPSRPPNPSS